MSPPRLSERDNSVLDELARSDDALLAFQGLRRRLGLHQQALTRSLRRLEADGFVERTHDGYRLSERGYGALSHRPGLPRHPVQMVLAKTLLPPGLATEPVVQHLAHRWFKGLRWYGMSESPGETRLTWLTEPGGGQVRVRIVAGHLLIETDADADAPRRPFEAARNLLSAVAEIYGMAPTDPLGLDPEGGYEPGTAA